MTREERFNMNMIDEFKQMCEIVEKDGRIIVNKQRMLKALEQEPDAIHNEREQAYMKGYEDASKRYRTEPCGDAISRSDAIRVASGYCHWSNIPDELEKLPPVSTETTNRCEDAISRQAAIDAMAKWDWQELYLPIHFKQLLDGLPSVSTEKTGRWILTSDYEYEYCTCSECGYQNEENWMIGSQIKYCQNCGARMEVEE